MTRGIGKLFGGGGGARTLAQARAAELRGDLAQAAALFGEAGRLDEAARVILLLGDAETDPARRLRHYVQAAAMAPNESPVRAHARRKRALLVVAIARNAAMTSVLRADVIEAARELESIGEHALAAEAYAQANDVDGQARALARVGDVERLDALLSDQQGHERAARAGRDAHAEFVALVSSGRRREAAALARTSQDEMLRERGRALEGKRACGPVSRIVVRGRAMDVVLGRELIIGRAPAPPEDQSGAAMLAIPSATLSRRHVAIARKAGEALVRDLASRNGTFLRGLALTGEASVGDGIELRLGSDVALQVLPTQELPDAFAIQIAGGRYVAPLGAATLGIGRWRLERRPDDWIELVTDDDPPAFAGPMQLSPRIGLLAGDAIAAERDGVPQLVVQGYADG
jgi:tetratricopeptide (TPR) repeat protein